MEQNINPKDRISSKSTLVDKVLSAVYFLTALVSLILFWGASLSRSVVGAIGAFLLVVLSFAATLDLPKGSKRGKYEGLAISIVIILLTIANSGANLSLGDFLFLLVNFIVIIYFVFGLMQRKTE